MTAIAKERIEEFNRQGFTVLDEAIDPETLARLREECAYFLGYTDAKMDADGVTIRGITHRGKRYFISGHHRKSRYMPTFVFGELMANVTRAFLGDTAYLFVEQWVVKGPEQGMQFAWHQDAGYVYTLDPGNVPPPYITCWCALDDMTEENGTIYVLPHDRAETDRQVVAHERELGTNDLVGYRGDDPGEIVVCKAGSIAVFSSTSLHRSSVNHTPSFRRAYLAQYSAEPILASNGKPWAFATPFIENGERVYEPAEPIST
jgi:ectoine hydroxylase-related dioxygenase (phytanoyl-CoA dioxygenase family)